MVITPARGLSITVIGFARFSCVFIPEKMIIVIQTHKKEKLMMKMFLEYTIIALSRLLYVPDYPEPLKLSTSNTGRNYGHLIYIYWEHV